MTRHIVVVIVAAVISLEVTEGGRTARAQDNSRFKAAVYAHRPTWQDPTDNTTTFEKAKELMKKNLDIYDEQAKTAARKGASIIVFPEYGLHPPQFPSRAIASYYVENIPEPGVPGPGFELNPCDEYSANDTSVLAQYSLSCMAKAHGIHVVANTGRYNADCKGGDFLPECEFGDVFHSTNVVYDALGNFIMRSDKLSMSREFEPYFTRPRNAPVKAFNVSDIGSFGTFTTNDILVYSPGIEVIRTGNDAGAPLTGVLYPTAWTNQMPFMEAGAYHSSVAIATGVNILAAGLHIPEQGLLGAGIYSGAYGEIEYYNNRDRLEGRLLLATLNKKPPQKEERDILMPDEVEECVQDFKTQIHGDEYTLRKLCKAEGQLTLQAKGSACHLQYKQQTIPKENAGYYALATFDGRHDFMTETINAYLEVCAVVWCSPDGSCGAENLDSSAILDMMTLTGRFSENVLVMPSVLFPNKVLDSSMWDYATDSKTNVAEITIEDLSEPITMAVLYGRYFSKDTVNAQDHLQTSFAPLLLLSVLALACGT